MKFYINLILWLYLARVFVKSAPNSSNEVFKSVEQKLLIDEEGGVRHRTRSVSTENNSNKSSENSLKLNRNDENILMSLTTAISSVKTPKCQQDIENAIKGIREREQWAMAMYDSSVKSPAGIEYGVTYQFGNFDECMSVNQMSDVAVKPKYCLADVVIDGYTIRSIASRSRKMRNSTLVHWGICMPSSCSSVDIVKFLSNATGYEKISLTHEKCHVEEPITFSSTDIIYGCVILSFVVMVLFSTVYHINTIYNPSMKKHGCFEDIMKAFSIVSNLKKLGKDSKDDHGLSCVNGIKAVAMFFILGGHALVFVVGGPVQNTGFFDKQTKLLQNAFLLNSPLLVDSFLLLSGFLFARLLLIELEKRNGKVNFGVLYVFRYIRLTPAYLAIIGLYATWLKKIGSGPLWDARMGLEEERCRNSWWKNILYINNYYGNDSLCMFQSWYLAADTQLFVIAPLFLYPLWKCRRVGIMILGSAFVVTVLIPFFVTFIGKLDPTFMIYADEIVDLSSNDYFINVYGKTHMRATAYVFGLLVGYLVHLMQEKNISIPKPVLYSCWMIASIIGILSMFSLSLFYNADLKYGFLENALYAGLHRFGWSLANGWLVLACVTGNGGFLKKALSWNALIPISRLTYCAYLTNGLVELYLAASIRTPNYMSVVNLTAETLSHITLTFLAALILCLMFESPIHGLEKILLRRSAPQSRDKQVDDNSVSTNNTQSTSEESA